MSMAGDYGTGLDLSVLQGLIPNLLNGGFGTEVSQDVLNVQENQLGNAADLIQLLMDPMFALLSGTADPLVYAAQQSAGTRATFPATPTIDRYAMSGVPVVSLVANGIKSGEYDLLQAQGILREAIANGEIPGYTPEMTDAAVQSMWDEQTKAEADYAAALADGGSGGGGESSGGGDVYSDALLPSPLETYQPTVTGPYSVPTNEQFKDRYVQTQQDVSSAEKALSKYDRQPMQSPDRITRESVPTAEQDRGRTEYEDLAVYMDKSNRFYFAPWAVKWREQNPQIVEEWNKEDARRKREEQDMAAMNDEHKQIMTDIVNKYGARSPQAFAAAHGGIIPEEMRPAVPEVAVEPQKQAAPQFDVGRSQLQGDLNMANYNQQVDDLTLRYLAQMKTNANQTPLTDTLRQRALKAQLMGIL